ncbi:hypothetical protein ACOMHN_013990 [Nucella lapillus]
MDKLDNMAITDRLSQMCFRVYTAEETRKMSVKEINDPQPFDNLNLPKIGGLYDPALGCSRNDDVCATCGLSGRGCPGHAGHIELALPVFSPVFFKTLLKEEVKKLFVYQMTLLEKGLIMGAQKLKEYMLNFVAEKADNFDSCKEELFTNLKNMVKEIKKEGQCVPGWGMTLRSGVVPLCWTSEPAPEGKDQHLLRAGAALSRVDLSSKDLDSLGPTQHASQAVTHCPKMIHSEIMQLVNDMHDQLASAAKTCPYCRTKRLTLISEYSTRIIAKGSLTERLGSRGKSLSQDMDVTEEENEIQGLLEKGGYQCYIMPHLARTTLQKILETDGQFMRKLFRCLEEHKHDRSATDMFFLSVVMVPANHFRPLSVMGDRKFENPQTACLSRILADNTEIRKLVSEMNMDTSEKMEVEGEGGSKARGGTESLQGLWTQLQSHVNSLIDSDLDKLTLQATKPPGVRQILEKKEGLFRMHMMGKRVNFAARSVISPDVSINTNEIGVPDVFACKLTYPQPVTPWNVHELRQNVINGPNEYPGASAVVNEDGSVVRLNAKDRVQREALAKTLLTPFGDSKNNQLPKKVLRHLKDGDVLLLNRQPTLHRPSIQAHRARVLPGEKTLRLHYSNCKAYNADFDGDEMNAHFPQSELGRAEAYGIVSTDFQYLVPKDGTPLAGLIQDHLVAAVALTLRGQIFSSVSVNVCDVCHLAGLIQDHLVAAVVLTLRGQIFSREDYCQLVHVALSDRRERTVKLPPAIIKPGPYWTGKQVVSTVLLNVIPKGELPPSLKSKTKIAEKSWITAPAQDPWTQTINKDKLQELGESIVVVSDGELLQGVLDKSQCGPTSFGLVHFVYELYGGEVAGQLLTCLGRLFTTYLKWRGFTLGVEDILVKKRWRGFTLGVEDILVKKGAESKRADIVRRSAKKGSKAAMKALVVSGEECSDEELSALMKDAHFDDNDFYMQHLDVTAKKVTFSVQDKISENTMGEGLYKNFPDNNLQLMVQSGAKGSTVNCLQISGLLGQIELEGRRPPLMISGRPLPSSTPYDPSLRSRGFVTGRFLTGITPQEFFPHCMAGREGLVDTAVKTSRSGYLQRCLVKHLEGLSVKYDMTVRDSDGSVVQFLYGEDGLEVTKTQLLEERQLPFLLQNQAVLGRHTCQAAGAKAVEKHKKKVNKWQQKHPEKTGRGSGFLDFCKSSSAPTISGSAEVDMTTGRSAHSKVLELEWRSLDPKHKHKFLKKYKPCPDPVLAKFWPQQNSGVLSEKMQKSVNIIRQQLMEVGRSCGDKAREEQCASDCETLTRLVNYKVMRSLCEPGEPVGVLCAQSLGEQTTQMTLNTFHFAGRGEMNVTMGIPRLREVLMTASTTILTPSMDVPVFDTPEAAQAAKTLQMKMNCVFLSDVLQDVRITDCLEENSVWTQRKVKIRLIFLPSRMYCDKLQMKRKDVIRLLENNDFFSKLGMAIHNAIPKHRRAARQLVNTRQTIGKDAERPDSSSPKAGDDDDKDKVKDTAVSDSDSSLEEEDDDGDASTVKERQRHSDMQEYEGEEEEKQEVGDTTLANEMEDYSPAEDSPAEKDQSEREEESEAEGIEDQNTAKIKDCSLVSGYTKDEKGKWCNVVFQFNSPAMELNVKTIVEKVVKKFTLQNIPGIKRCMLIERSDDVRFKGHKRLYFVTDGINLMEMMKHSDVLDMNHMYTNSIVDIQNTYGIEAANKAIIREVQQVFKAYNIQVNYRHLSLLADYMTCEGSYKGFNRNSIASNPSPMQKITFETATNFLVNSCLNSWSDQLQSPSAQIVAGRVVSSGTGCFDILQSLVV